MNTKRKMEIIITIITVGIIAASAAVSYWFFLRNTGAIEHSHLEEEASSAVSIVSMKIDELEKINRDYAEWDDTLEYYRHGSEAYAEETFTKDVFENLRISHMLFLSEEGRVKSGYSALKSPGQVVPMAEDDALAFTSKYGGIISANLTGENSMKGIAQVEGQACLISICQISNNRGDDSEGVMAIARPINDRILTIIQSILGSSVVFDDASKGELFNPGEIADYFHVSVGNFVTTGKMASVRVSLMDMRWEPVIGLKIEYETRMEAMRNQTVLLITLIAFVSVLAMTLLHTWLNGTFVLKPIRVLGEFFDNLSEKKQMGDLSVFSDRMLFKEEASVLGRVHMLLRQISENALQLQKDRLSTELALNSSVAGTWEFNRRKNQIQADARTIALLGRESADFPMPFETLLDTLHAEDRDDFAAMFIKCQNKGERGFQMECRICGKPGTYGWFHVKGHALDWDREGNGTLFSGILLDIQEKKQMESELLHLRTLLGK